jgi:hypothetical protein
MYRLALTQRDKKNAEHIDDGIYIKRSEDGFHIELFVSDGVSKSEPVYINPNNVERVVAAIERKIRT